MCDMAVIKHPWRNCLYEEASVVIAQSLAKESVTKKQIKKYKKENYPANYGLMAGCFIIRHNTNNIKIACKIWSEEYRTGCRRDQISLSYAFWKSERIGHKNNCKLLNWTATYSREYFLRVPHLPVHHKTRKLKAIDAVV